MTERLDKVKEKWNGMADRWNDFRSEGIISAIIENPYSVFRPELQNMLKMFVKDFSGKRVLVPASGDNRAVFAFNLLGASVTSVDISEKQLANSADISIRHGWDIDFVCDDLMNMGKIESDFYDLVYISNGVMVWVDKLDLMYKNISRVLKNGGHYIMYDKHPFMPPFDEDSTSELVIKKDYDSTGPFGELATFNWRLSDILNAMVSHDLTLKHIEELHAEYDTYWIDEDKARDIPKSELSLLYDSKTNPLYALPQTMVICARKGR